jgi:hypothetical protein
MLSGRNLRRLLELRRRIRIEVLSLPISRQRRLLRDMEMTRRQRLPGPRDPLRELAAGEVLREIKWMVGTLSLEEAEAAVRALDRLMRLPRRPSARR